MTLLLAILLQAEGPLRLPAGWEGSKQEGAFVASPKDLGEGKVYTMIVPELQAKLGSIDALLDGAKATLGEVGAFKALREPSRAKNDAGWDYALLVGTIEKDGKGLVAQAAVLRKGEDEAMLLVLSDSGETLQKYAEAFGTMLRAYGAPKAVAGAVDLRYAKPEGWTVLPNEAGTLLRGTLDERDFRLLILPSRALGESLRSTYLEIWTSTFAPAVGTKVTPLPLARRMKSGLAVAVDGDDAAVSATGVKHHAGMYLLAKGGRCVPILSFYFGLGGTKELDRALEAFFESAEIPGAGKEATPLFSSGALAGTWNESSLVLGNYVTRTGDYAGDASLAGGTTFELRADGSYRRTSIEISAKSRLKDVEEGTWSLEDADLRLKAKDKTRRWRVFGSGPSFLVLSQYSDTDQAVDFSIPRRLFSGTWYKKKD